MIRLDSTLRKLRIVLNAATTTSALPIVVCWSDKTSAGYNGSATTSLSSGTTPVDIVAAPFASTVRDIDFISIFNADTVAATVSVIYSDNSVTSILTQMTLASGSTLKYTHAGGWQSTDKNGNQTASPSNLTGPISSLSGVTSITAQTGTGTTFVMNTSPTLITPVLGAATGTSVSLSGQYTSTLAAGTAPLVITSTTLVPNLYVARAVLADSATVNANLTGEVTSVGNATTLTNAAAIGKVITGYVSGAGVVAATDTILQAFQKLNGNNATNANLTGPITSVGNATAVASQTGTGSTFVMQTSPTLITPVLGLATGTSLSLANGTLTSLTITGTSGGPNSLISAVLNGVGSVAFIDSYSGGAIATNHNIAFRAARGTVGTPTASQTDDRLGWFNFRGYGTTAFAGTARAGLSSYAAENWTDTAQGTYFSTLVTAVGSAVMNERMRVDGIGTRIAGFLTVGSITAGAAQIDINSGVTAASWTTNGIGLAARANTYIDSSTAASGTAATNHIYAFAAPTLAATNTLVTTTNAATVYIAGAPIAGANETITNPWALLIGANGIGLADGAAGSPALAFASYPAYGLYNHGGGRVNWCVNSGTSIFCIGIDLSPASNVCMVFNSSAYIGFNSAPSNPATAILDAGWTRDGAGIIAQKNLTNAQEHRIYGTTTGSKYLSLKHDGTNAIISTTAGSINISQKINLPSFTVAGLPAGTANDKAFVTDALTPAFGTAVAGGGAVRVPVYYTGAAWFVG